MIAYTRFVSSTVLTLLLLGTFVGGTSLFGQSQSGKASREILDEKSSVARDLQLRYNAQLVHLEATEGGAIQGLFTIAGDLTPPTFLKDSAVSETFDPRDVALAFLLQEENLFSLNAREEDLRLVKILNDAVGAVHLVFHRWISGIRLDGVEFRVHIDATGNVYAVDGRSAVVSSAEEVAIASQLAECSLDKEAVAALILQDLHREGILAAESIGLRQLERVALPTFPYVIWKGDVVDVAGNGRWFYEIDAATGEVLERLDALKMVDGKTEHETVGVSTAPSDQSMPPVRLKSAFSPLSLEEDKVSVPITGLHRLVPKETGAVGPIEGLKKEIPAAQAIAPAGQVPSDYETTEQAQAKRRVEL